MANNKCVDKVIKKDVAVKLYDCFLFNDEIELLEIRLKLIGHIVDYFVIIQSTETFSGGVSVLKFPTGGEIIKRYGDKIRLISLEVLIGKDAWARESFSRDAMRHGLTDASDVDLIMVSDVDELPHPDVLARLKRDGVESSVSLVLDYFNFKFNYKLVSGLDVFWAGPVIVRASGFLGGQATRDSRWKNMEQLTGCIFNSGWHFSYVTSRADVSEKLASFSHQEVEMQSRRDLVLDMIRSRQGFHDHMYPGSVWAVVPLVSLGCEPLCQLIEKYPKLICTDDVDLSEEIDHRVRGVVRRVAFRERQKFIRFYTFKELAQELAKRLSKKFFAASR